MFLNEVVVEKINEYAAMFYCCEDGNKSTIETTIWEVLQGNSYKLLNYVLNSGVFFKYWEHTGETKEFKLKGAKRLHKISSRRELSAAIVFAKLLAEILSFAAFNSRVRCEICDTHTHT